MNLNILKRQFLEYLEIEKGRSRKTIENYDHYLRIFFSWAKIGRPEDINEDLVRNYRIHLNRLEDASGRNLKKITQGYYVIALRSFLKYLAKRDIPTLLAEKVEIGKVLKKEVDFLEFDEVERILNAADGSSLKATRDRAMMELLFSSGLRVSELCSLNRNKMDLNKQEFTVRGKGGKLRIVFISQNARKYLEKYLEMRTDIDQALFVRDVKSLEKFESVKGKAPSEKENISLRLSPRSVQRIVKYYAAKAGLIKDVHPHTLRHSFATDLLMNGADIRSVQAMLGHSSITTTQVYTHITNQQLRDVHKAFHGRRRKK
jgi:site-specific recombinase XerD